MDNDLRKQNDKQYPSEYLGYVNFPYKQKIFNAFVKDLFSHAFTYEKTFRGTFVITYDKIEYIHQLLCQRIKEQNKSYLKKFSVKVFFSDSSSIVFDNIKEFANHKNINDIRPTKIFISWIFDICFKESLETKSQYIELLFSDYANEPIVFRTNSTAKTWGKDIANTLSDYIESIKIKKIYKKNIFYKFYTDEESIIISLSVFILIYEIVMIIFINFSISRLLSYFFNIICLNIITVLLSVCFSTIHYIYLENHGYCKRFYYNHIYFFEKKEEAEAEINNNMFYAKKAIRKNIIVASFFTIVQIFLIIVSVIVIYKIPEILKYWNGN